MGGESEFSAVPQEGIDACKFESLVWGAIFFVLVAFLQFYLPYPIDDDTAYHFSVSELIRKNGILVNFPWTRFSLQFDHYGDKEFLFHLLFIPFSALGFVNASRAVGIIGGSLILVTLYTLLRREKIRNAGLWTLLPLTVSLFAYRFAQVRPQLFSIALALAFLWSYSRRRYWLLLAVSVLYPLSYVAFWQIPLLLVAATEAARRTAKERFTPKQLLTVCAGVAIGIALHPNSINLMTINWVHMTDVLMRNAWGNKVEFNMGQEFDPLTISEWLTYLLAPAGMAIWALNVSWRHRKADALPLAVALAALLFGLLTARTNRFLEYFVPLAVLALALVSRWIAWRHLAPALLAISLMFTLTVATGPFVMLRSPEISKWVMEPEVVHLMAREVPVGAKVFTTGWEYTGSLLLNLPGRYYMVALDPTLMYKSDPKLYTDWYHLLLDAPGNAADIVRTRFDSRYVISQNHTELWPFFNALAVDARVKVLLSNDKWLLFDLGATGTNRGQVGDTRGKS
ncbi:hypothetical protein OR1_02819 [Geobacter sp. OR-1]|uniref:hypothetical protein n=1 Tax=Geobacter sp. OR-1 TaxID=1266765 RepID=UPI0005429E13|nr:hypothetical protein [Geobacter sp. OR-1]GAM10530.1 hypothetical protein OR1_02819 [Geobacter sp. OR-1]